jgi:hypothetical protein
LRCDHTCRHLTCIKFLMLSFPYSILIRALAATRTQCSEISVC